MKKFIIAGSVLLGLVVFSALGLYLYLQQTRTHYEPVVNFQNISSAKLVNTATDSEQTINIDKDNPLSLAYNSSGYQVEYKATDGYADGIYRIKPNQTDISIQPDLSQQSLDKLFAGQQTNIHQAISKKYPSFDSVYKIYHESLYGDGSWYGASLKYIGEGIFNRDSVGMVLKLDGDTWQVITDPPLPSLNIYHKPAIPENLVRDINSRLQND